MKVLLAVDRSRHSMAVALFLQWLRLQVESRLTLLHVIDPPLEGQAPLLTQFPWYKIALVAERKKIRARAQQFVNRLQKPFPSGDSSRQPETCCSRVGSRTIATIGFPTFMPVLP